jgi:hypothetical protein
MSALGPVYAGGAGGVTTAATGFSWAGLEEQAASVAASSIRYVNLELDDMV